MLAVKTISVIVKYMNRKILIVDDDKDLTYIMAKMLADHGYEVECACTVEEAEGLLSKGGHHLILLDINLPDSDGYDLCKRLRRVSEVPVIFASARTAENDRIKGYDIGGDDYLSKPYSMKELLSRVNALMRRTYGFGRDEENLSFGDVVVDKNSRKVTRGGNEVNLSLREFDLLSYLLDNSGKALPKEKIISDVWGSFADVEPSTLTVQIRWLREKLEEDPSSPRYIKTIRGIGYKLDPEGSLT